jgi:hypothetical protein
VRANEFTQLAEREEEKTMFNLPFDGAKVTYFSVTTK